MADPERRVQAPRNLAAPAFVRETCWACTGRGSIANDGTPCGVCHGSGRWLRDVWNERLSGELRDERCGIELGGAVLERSGLNGAVDEQMAAGHG